MAQGSVPQKHTRRGFLDILLGTAVFGWAASALYPVLRYLTPLPVSGPGGPARLSAQDMATLERESFVIVPVSGSRVLVFMDPERRLRALSAACTHEGCTVQYVPGESVVWCACHNARFDVEGRVLSGPPPRPLPAYHAQHDDDGQVVVSEPVV